MIYRQVDPAQLKTGDVIVVNVPTAAQTEFNYPSRIIHRAIDVVHANGLLTIQTKGDATRPEPFKINGADVGGLYVAQVPYLGYGLLYVHSKQGVAYLIFAGALIGLYLYGEPTLRFVRRAALGPIAEMPHAVGRPLERDAKVEQALNSFATAMQDYATHLASHTSAVINLSDSAKQISDAVQEQRRFLETLYGFVAERQSDDPAVNPDKPPARTSNTVSAALSPEVRRLLLQVRSLHLSSTARLERTPSLFVQAREASPGVKAKPLGLAVKAKGYRVE